MAYFSNDWECRNSWRRMVFLSNNSRVRLNFKKVIIYSRSTPPPAPTSLLLIKRHQRVQAGRAAVPTGGLRVPIVPPRSAKVANRVGKLAPVRVQKHRLGPAPLDLGDLGGGIDYIDFSYFGRWFVHLYDCLICNVRLICIVGWSILRGRIRRTGSGGASNSVYGGQAI